MYKWDVSVVHSRTNFSFRTGDSSGILGYLEVATVGHQENAESAPPAELFN